MRRYDNRICKHSHTLSNTYSLLYVHRYNDIIIKHTHIHTNIKCVFLFPLLSDICMRIFRNSWSRTSSYVQSKAMLVAFAFELQRRYSYMGLYANALEPGMSVCNVNACACVCVCVHVNVTSIVTIHCMFYMACLNYVAIFLFF